MILLSAQTVNSFSTLYKKEAPTGTSFSFLSYQIRLCASGDLLGWRRSLKLPFNF